MGYRRGGFGSALAIVLATCLTLQVTGRLDSVLLRHLLQNDCSSSRDCPPTQFCKSNTCQNKFPVASVCYQDDNCKSNICDYGNSTTSGFCAPKPCNSTAPCDDGEYCSPQKQCAPQLGDGRPCDVNNWCKSGYCNLNLPIPVCASRQSCFSNSQCTSAQFCNAQYYCQDKLNNGAYCTSGSQCSSGYCNPANVCATRNLCYSDSDCTPSQFCNSRSQCQAKLANGQPCDADSWCSSGYCQPFGPGFTSTCAARPSDRCYGDSNCLPNQFCNSQNRCQTKLANGQYCEEDSWCVSGYCLSYGPGFTTASAVCATRPNLLCASNSDCLTSQFCNSQSRCQAKLANGQYCADNSWCASGYCLRYGPGFTASDAQCATAPNPRPECIISANCLPTQFCNNQNRCQAKLDNGQICYGDDWCQSANCDSSNPSTGPRCQPSRCLSDINCLSFQYCNSAYNCISKRTNGQSCTAPNQCTSGYCDPFQRCAVPPTPLPSPICSSDANCPSGWFCHPLVSTCLAKYPAGFPCSAGNWCTTGYCSPAGICAASPAPTPPAPTPGTCSSDANCVAGQFCHPLVSNCLVKYPDGFPCSQPNWCASGYCSPAGTCTVSPTPVPLPPATSCPTACPAGQYCSGSTCVPTLAVGSSCSGNSWCTSGFCSVTILPPGNCTSWIPQPCVTSSTCPAGQYCLVMQPTSLCYVKAWKGETCYAPEGCLAGLVCTNGKCV